MYEILIFVLFMSWEVSLSLFFLERVVLLSSSPLSLRVFNDSLTFLKSVVNTTALSFMESMMVCAVTISGSRIRQEVYYIRPGTWIF